jgi:8-oxo-dGTP pyrophosphatase MutT (NUDIX family)
MAQRAEEHGAEERVALLTSARALIPYLVGALANPAEAEAPAALASLAAHSEPRAAGVLVPLYARDDRPHLLFTRRATTLAAHSGEISFPGGSRDPADTSLVATALREAEEEVGIPPGRVQVLGRLEPVFTTVSNYLMTPVVGWLGEVPVPLAPNPDEVTEIIEAPVGALADPAIFHAERWLRQGQPHIVYFYDLGQHRIWGATARVLHHLLELLPA